MTLEILNNRKVEIKNLVLLTLRNYGNPFVPVEIGNIIRKMNNIKLITYSSQMKKYHISYEKMILSAETKDSYAVWDRKQRYCIYYNDMDSNIIQSHRVRWNLAHELGHIVLQHHQYCNSDRLFRNSLDDNTYYYLEKEADYFAQLILVPHVVLSEFKISSIDQLKTLCKISRNAAKYRFQDYQKWKSSHINIQDEYDQQLFQYYYNFLFKRHCQTCGATLIQRYGDYCQICGKKTLQWGNGNMFYPQLKTYTSGKLIVCPNCGNQETNILGEYCQICGCHLVNRCNDLNCQCNYPLLINARYCPICGGSTSFYNQYFLKDWYDDPDSMDVNDVSFYIPLYSR